MYAPRALVVGAVVFLAGCSPPQLGDKESMGAVDALFTALNSRRPNLLEQCTKRLQTLREKGKLSEAAAKRLDSIIAEANKGDWEPAARRLADFMKGQRGV